MADRFRVLHVSTTSAGGLGTSLLSIVRALDATRFRVEVALGIGHPLDGAFERAGIRLHALQLSRGIRPLQFVRTIVRLTILMRREHFDALHVHGSEAGILARIAGRIAGVPVMIVELHGYANRDPDSLLERTLYRWIEKALDGMTDAYVAVSHHVKRQWLARGICVPDKLRVIHHALVLHDFPDRGAIGRTRAKDGGLLVGTVCLLEARKGLEALVEAMPAVLAKVPSVRFAIVGDGELMPWMQRRTRELGLATCVDFMGWRFDVPDLMWRFDVFALPSRRESFGLVFLEAMASRCPVVGSHVDGIPEVVEHGETGLLIPPDSPPALAAAIVELLTDTDKARRFGDAGRLRVEALFDADRMAREYNALYGELLERSFGAGARTSHDG